MQTRYSLLRNQYKPMWNGTLNSDLSRSPLYTSSYRRI